MTPARLKLPQLVFLILVNKSLHVRTFVHVSGVSGVVRRTNSRQKSILKLSSILTAHLHTPINLII